MTITIPGVRRLGRTLLTLLAVTAALLAPALPAPDQFRLIAAAQAADVVADDDRDAFVGTGGLLLPGTVDASTRRTVAGCPGCRWRLTSPCVEQPLGNAFEGQPVCLSVTRGCPVGSLRRTWFQPEGGAWRDLGLMCMQAEPLTVESVGGQLRDDLLHRLPPLAVGWLPTTGVVTGIPTVFATGQPGGAQRFSWRIGGREVVVDAVPRWSWRFPDGTRLTTDDPGALSAEGGVRHAFRRSGPTAVTCASRWVGEFTVDGLGPFPIPGAVTQESTVRVSVGEGRALLTP